MAVLNTKKMPDTAEKEDEEMRLEAELRAKIADKKAVFEATRETDELLRKIKEEERQIKAKLHRIKSEKIESEQMERQAADLEAEKKNAKQLADLRVESEALRNENDQLRREMAALTNDAYERTSVPGQGGQMEGLEVLRRKMLAQNEAMKKMKERIQRITSYSKTQQKERREKEEDNVKLKRRIKCLEDEFVAAQRIAVETQLRQLDELQSQTNETRELKQTLTELRQQQQQQATEDHHVQGS